MRTNLLYKERYLTKTELDTLKNDLIQDLGLEVIFDAMSKGDEFIKDTVKNVLTQPLTEASEIVFRQEIVKDAIEKPELFKKLFELAIETLESKKRTLLWMVNKKPSGVLFSNLRMLELLLEYLRKLWEFSEENKNSFNSFGMRRFISEINQTLNPEYLSKLSEFIDVVEFKTGLSFSAKLGYSNRIEKFIVRYKQESSNIIKKLFTKEKGYSFTIDERDEAGFRALSEIKDKAIADLAVLLFNCVSHLLEFFERLKEEMAFYLGATNLYNAITQMGYPLSFPRIEKRLVRKYTNLYDLSLALISKKPVVGNDLNLIGKDVIFVVGANQGGKTTFLRSLGLAQLLYQAGLFVPCESMHSHIVNGIFTHFKREEDVSLKSGKLDDELRRMNLIIAALTKHALILSNESFASTNEQEGSEIASDIINALKENEIEIIYVTHMFSLAKNFAGKDYVEFLVAEVRENGMRTFKVKPGKPVSTSRAKDLFYQIYKEQL